MSDQKNNLVVLGGVMVSVLAVGPTFAGSYRAEDDGFLWAKDPQRPCLRREVKPEAPVIRLYGTLKITSKYKKDTS
jgi:hypothetical protein